jgi:hypothetical protein
VNLAVNSPRVQSGTIFNSPVTNGSELGTSQSTSRVVQVRHSQPQGFSARSVHDTVLHRAFLPLPGGKEPPEGEAPEGEAPEGEAPEGEAPEGEAPEGEAPEGEAPEEGEGAEEAEGPEVEAEEAEHPAAGGSSTQEALQQEDCEREQPGGAARARR